MNAFLMTKEKLFVLTSLFLFVAGVVVILVSQLYKLNKGHIGVAFALPPLVYIILKRGTRKHQEIPYEASRPTFLLLTMMFAMIMFLGLLDWYAHVYQRSLLFFVLVSIASLIVMEQIFLTSNGKYAALILLEIFAVAITVRGSIYFNFPTVYGYDPFFHLEGIELTASSGFLSPALERYADFSFMHVFTVITSQILGIGLKTAYFCASLIEVSGAVFVFIIGRMIAGQKIGLLGAAIIAFAPYNVYWGFWITPMTFGLGFFMLILYLVIKKTFNHSRKILGLLMFSLVSSILIHPVVSFVTCLILLLIVVWQTVYRSLRLPSRNIKTVTLDLVVLFASAMLLYWTTVYAPAGSDFFSEVSRSLLMSLRTTGATPVTAVTLAPVLNYSSILLSDLPFTLMLFLGFLGLTFLLDKKLDSLIFAWAFSSIFLTGLVYGLGFLAMDAFLPARWFPFIEIMLAPFAAYGAYLLVSTMKTFKRQLFLSLPLFFVLVFSATTSPINNGESAFYAKEMSGRSALTESEVIAATFVSTHFTGIVSRSSRYVIIEGDLLNPNDPTTYSDRMVILRDYDIEKGFIIPLFGAGGKLLEIVYPDELFYSNISRYNIVYENGEVRAHLPP